MAHWDYTKETIVHAPDTPYPHFQGWLIRDCGCCDGLQWGGEEPRECATCDGSGRICIHIKSGVIAEYPGGPMLGRLTKSERAMLAEREKEA